MAIVLGGSLLPRGPILNSGSGLRHMRRGACSRVRCPVAIAPGLCFRRPVQLGSCVHLRGCRVQWRLQRSSNQCLGMQLRRQGPGSGNVKLRESAKQVPVSAVSVNWSFFRVGPCDNCVLRVSAHPQMPRGPKNSKIVFSVLKPTAMAISRNKNQH